MATGVGEQAEKIVDGIIENLSIQDETKKFWKAIDDGRKAQMRAIWMLVARRVIERR
jgi:hypothetical protein